MANQFVATQDLFIGRHRAHLKGDLVPEENIEPNGWKDLVARVGTKQAEQAQSSTPVDTGADRPGE